MVGEDHEWERGDNKAVGAGAKAGMLGDSSDGL